MRERKISWLDHIRKMFCMGAASVVLGTLLLTLVFCLPTESVRRHVFTSVERIVTDGSQESARGLKGYLQQNKETFTEAIMVQNAFEDFPDRNPFEHAMWVYHLDLDETLWTPEISLKYLSQGGDVSAMYERQYSRYWHGYLIYLKPLLLLFTWEQLLWVGAVFQVLLTAATLLAAWRTGHPEVGLALLIGVLFMKPILMLTSLAMTVCWVITLAAVLLILLRFHWLEEKELFPELFLMIGVAVAYFDFLTYPIVTLGFPLCTLFLIKRSGGLKEQAGRMIACSFSWVLGYVAMWASKWVLADLTLHTGTIKSAVSSILGWTEAIGGRPRFNGGFYVIGLNLQEYSSWIYPAMAILLAVFDAAAFVVAVRRSSLKRALGCCVPYLMTACLPFAWYIVVQHHSGLHVPFTFRIVSVAAMAMGAAGLRLLAVKQGRAGEEDVSAALGSRER